MHGYGPPHHNGSVAASTSTTAGYVGTQSQYGGRTVADPQVPNETAIHRKRKLGDLDDDRLHSQPNKRASHTTPSLSMLPSPSNSRPAARSLVDTPNRNIPSSARISNNGHSNNSSSLSRSHHSRRASQMHWHPGANVITSEAFSDSTRRSGFPMNGEETVPPPTPPQVIRKVKLVVKPQEKFPNDPMVHK
jgi:hypothetical protein